jgi:phosphoserine phosphatase RsbU/P
MLGPTGPALGAIPDAQHAVHQVHMDHGDLLFAYTDGLTEAENSADQIFRVELPASVIGFICILG